MTSTPSNPPPPRPGTQRPGRLWAFTAAAAGLFSVAVVAGLWLDHFRVPSQDPLKSVEIAEAKEQLRAAPKDEQLKQAIRDLDLQVRRRYFRHLSNGATGAWLLLGGAAVFLLAARRAARMNAAPPMPNLARPGVAEAAGASSARGRWAVAGVTLALGAGLLALAAAARSRLPERTADLEALLAGAAPAAEEAAGPTVEEMLRNWHQFRGPWGDGVSFCTNAPLAWNGSTGEGIRWKTAVPVKGFSSPVVWSNRVFLTGGDDRQREALCFDADTGSLLWRKTVPSAPQLQGRKMEIQEQTGYAASTGATDGRRFFAIFATGDLAAFDFSGNVVWNKSFGFPESVYGFATSLRVWQNRLIVQLDQGEAEEGRSRLYAFDPATGRTVWEQRRTLPGSWATPGVIECGGRLQIVALGDPWAVAYDFASGEELWRADCLGSDVAPSPILAGGFVLAINAGKQMTALRPDGRGDVTKSHVAWFAEDFIPDITSPVSDGKLVFLISTEGTLTCMEVATGARVWEQQLELEFNASPTLAGDRLLLLSTKGLAIHVAADRVFRELSRSELGEGVHASPALVNDRLYVRGLTNLYCIGAPSGAPGSTAHAP